MQRSGVSDMRKNQYLINVLHMMIVGFFCLMAIFIKTFFPYVLIPKISIPLLVLFSLIPMVLAYYMKAEGERNLLITAVLAGLTYAMFPFCSGLDTEISFVSLFLIGTIVFWLTDLCYESLEERMRTGPHYVSTPVANAFAIYLASQCFHGLL